MRGRAGITLVELLFVLAVVVLVAFLLLPALARARGEARRTRCKSNLAALCRGMYEYAYPGGQGERLFTCPLGRCAQGSGAGTYNGAEWLAALYWTGVVPESELFLCPSSGDRNANGRDIGSHGVNDVAGGMFGSQTVSYASMWWKSVTTLTGGRIVDDFPPAEPMICDDTQGGINHGTASSGGMNILFFDGHVQFRTTPEVDVTSTPSGSVDKGFPNPPKTLLWRLKN